MQKRFITPADKFQYFFGYYDLQPYDETNEKHLVHRVKFLDREPTAEDIAELGYVKDGTFFKISETTSWNFQQGSMMQWYESGKSVIFNDFDGKGYVSRVVGIDGKEIDGYDCPFATINFKSGKAVSVNFSRIYDFRRGYGYCNIPDPFANVNAPDDDGIFLVDLRTKEKKLLASYSIMKKAFEEKPFTDKKLVVNHITFNPSGTKCVFLLRNFPDGGKMWATVLAVIDMAGNITQLTKFEVNSHYSWKDDDNLMIYSGLPEWGIYFFNVTTGERRRLNDPLCDHNDIHCNYSPDRKSFIGDGYPYNDMSSIYYYDFTDKKSKELIKVYSSPVNDIDIRCDLHARWSKDGKRISYDTTEDGNRRVAEIIL